MIYLRFQIPKTIKENTQTNKVKEFLLGSVINILKKVIPEANPDYDEKINYVETWLIELEIKHCSDKDSSWQDRTTYEELVSAGLCIPLSWRSFCNTCCIQQIENRYS